MTLANLKHGDRAVITHIELDAGDTARLAARGIVPGTRLGILQSGDPVLIGIDNDRWALNRLEAAAIHVDLLRSKKRFLSALFGRS